MDLRRQKRVTESELRRGVFRPSTGRGRVIGRREVMHLGGLQLTRVSARLAPSRDKYEHIGMARNVLLSQTVVISPAPVTTT